MKVIWYTGLPCSGKTENASRVVKRLHSHGIRAIHLDGDTIRGTPISSDLGFSKEDRDRHILRIGYLATMFAKEGIWVVCSFVSPYRETRAKVREMCESESIEFIEIYMDTPISLCVKRDTKGMWEDARVGKIQNFTGMDAPYETPLKPDIHLSGEVPLGLNVDTAMEYLNVPPLEDKPHLVFIGRWCPFHNGHAHVIKQASWKAIYHTSWPMYHFPVLILIRNTPNDTISVQDRQNMIDKWLKDENISGQTMIIPDIHGVYYGRGVGYEVEEVEVPDDIKGISATAIRKAMKAKDDSWVEYVPKSVSEYLKDSVEDEPTQDGGE